MAYLDEIAALLEGSSDVLYPTSSGDYLVSFESTDTGLYFQESTSDAGLATLTTSTWPIGLTANANGNYVEDFGATAGANSPWPIYKSHLPDSTVIGDRAVALIETAGSPEYPRDGVDKNGLQVVVRGAKMSTLSTAYEEAEAEADDIKETLIVYAGSTKTLATHYVGIWNESGPFFAGFDAAWRPQHSANYRAWRAR